MSDLTPEQRARLEAIRDADSAGRVWTEADGRADLREDLRSLIAAHDALVPYKDELLKIAESVGEADDPFAAWESIETQRASYDARGERIEALTLLLTDLKIASAVVEAAWPARTVAEYEHWNACIDAASAYLAKDTPESINETAP